MYTACSRSGPSVIERWQPGRRLTLVAAGIAIALGPIACSSQQESGNTATPEPTGTTEATLASELSGEGALTEPGQASNAFTYNPAVAPSGARLAVTLTPSQASTTATFDVVGLLPDRGYAVHLHNKACGPTGDVAGPHFQHRIDPAATPEQPSTDPEYANPSNEIWLDVRTDAAGSGTASTEVPFVFTDRVPASVVVHEEMKTATEPGNAGKAGARAACFTLNS